MALSNVLLLSQIAGNIVQFILSLCLIIPLVIHHHQFKGHCLLFTTGAWQEEDGRFDAKWSSTEYCSFPLFLGIVMFILGSVQIYRYSMLLYKELESSFLGLFLDVVISIWLCAMTILAATMISLGFFTWCSEMTERFPSCDIADGQNITKVDLQINTSGFYIGMGTAQFGAWFSFAILVGLAVVAMIKLVNNHQMRNMKVSMYLERQRLVNEDSFQENFTDPPTPSTSTPTSVRRVVTEVLPSSSAAPEENAT